MVEKPFVNGEQKMPRLEQARITSLSTDYNRGKFRVVQSNPKFVSVLFRFSSSKLDLSLGWRHPIIAAL